MFLVVSNAKTKINTIFQVLSASLPTFYGIANKQINRTEYASGDRWCGGISRFPGLNSTNSHPLPRRPIRRLFPFRGFWVCVWGEKGSFGEAA